jgi:hypothetical protein
MPVGEHTVNDLGDSKFFPKPFKDQGRPYLLGLRDDIGIARQYQKHPLGVSRKGADEGFYTAFFINQLNASQSADHSLNNLALDFTVLDYLQVLVLSGFFESCKHGSPSGLRHSQNTSLNVDKSREKYQSCGTTFSAFSNPGSAFMQVCGS